MRVADVVFWEGGEGGGKEEWVCKATIKALTSGGNPLRAPLRPMRQGGSGKGGLRCSGCCTFRPPLSLSLLLAFA